MAASPAESTEVGRPPLRALGVSLLLNGACPFALYQILRAQGVATVPALAATAVFPALGILAGFVRTRRAEGLSLLVLVFIVLGVAASLISNSTRFALVKESALTGLLGLAFLSSLLWRRPLTFYFGRQFVAGGDRARLARWDGLWRYPDFRRAQRIIAAIWGAGLLLEAATRVVLSYVVSASAVVAISGPLSIGVVLALILWTMAYGRRVRQRSQRTAPPR